MCFSCSESTKPTNNVQEHGLVARGLQQLAVCAPENARANGPTSFSSRTEPGLDCELILQDETRNQSNIFAGLRSCLSSDRPAEAVKRDRTRESAGNLDSRAATKAVVETVEHLRFIVGSTPGCVHSQCLPSRYT